MQPITAFAARQLTNNALRCELDRAAKRVKECTHGLSDAVRELNVLLAERNRRRARCPVDGNTP